MGEYQKMPPVETHEVSQDGGMQIFIPGQDCTYGMSTLNVLPTVNPYIQKDLFIELYNNGRKDFSWKATTKENWLKLSKQSGKTALQERITLSVDWTKVPSGTDITGEIEIVSGGKTEKVYLPVFNPQSPSVDELRGMYVEDNGCVSINAGKFHRKVENNGEIIRIGIPPLTEERRKQLAKQCKAEGETAKVSVRNARRDAIDALKKSVKDGLAEDAQKGGEEKLQKIHDKYIKQIDDMLAAKDKEIMTV